MERKRVFTYKIEESVYGVKMLINKGETALMQVFISHVVGDHADACVFFPGRI